MERGWYFSQAGRLCHGCLVYRWFIAGLSHDPAFFDEFKRAGALVAKLAWSGVSQHQGLAKGVSAGIIGLSADDIGLEFAAQACEEDFDFIDIELVGGPDQNAIAGVFWAFKDR